MILRKWNYLTHQYEPHIVPDDWHVTAYEADMEAKVNCACCGKQITHGQSYCSLEIHTHLGFGYDVCEGCYAEEMKRRLENERQCQTEG